jgi:hypothetical protein
MGESVERAGYRVKSKHAMLPSNLFDIQRWSRFKNSLYVLWWWCSAWPPTPSTEPLDLLDYSQGHSKTFEDFENFSDLWRASVLKITYLAQGVREKQTSQAAKEHVYQIRFKPKRCARLCNLHHLLVFVHCSDHRSGPLFPNDVSAFGDTPTPPTGAPNDPHPDTTYKTESL